MVRIKWPDRKKEEWLPKDHVKNQLQLSRSGTNKKETFELTQIYNTMRRIDGVRNNEMQTYLPMMQTNLPFSDLGDFLNLVESNKKMTLKREYRNKVAECTKKEAKKAKRKAVKCKDCKINQARRKGQLCNKCYNLKMIM